MLFWEFNHFVVLEGFSGNRGALNDPATGPRWVSLEAFSAGFTGVVLQRKPGAEFRHGGRAPSGWGLLLGRLRQEWPAALFALLAGALLILPRLAMPVLTQIYIDDVCGDGAAALAETDASGDGAHHPAPGHRRAAATAGAGLDPLQDPSVRILDEATSSLDDETELRVEEALRQRACTRIEVAHRLSTVRDADLILVLERGQVVQRGRHWDLMAATGGAFVKLLAEGETGG